jgi:medium-chain acyl-[acyl-carrier-protein] hydrolase
MGALVSFELARALRDRHRLEPIALYVAAQPAPLLSNKRTPLHALPDVELRAELRRLGGTPQEVLANDEFMELLLPTLRADFEVCETYTYTTAAPLQCPIVAFGGTDDPQVSEQDLEKWGEMSTGEFALSMLAGGHLFIDHNRRALLAALNASLDLITRR